MSQSEFFKLADAINQLNYLDNFLNNSIDEEGKFAPGLGDVGALLGTLGYGKLDFKLGSNGDKTVVDLINYIDDPSHSILVNGLNRFTTEFNQSPLAEKAGLNINNISGIGAQAIACLGCIPGVESKVNKVINDASMYMSYYNSAMSTLDSLSVTFGKFGKAQTQIGDLPIPTGMNTEQALDFFKDKDTVPGLSEFDDKGLCNHFSETVIKRDGDAYNGYSVDDYFREEDGTWTKSSAGFDVDGNETGTIIEEGINPEELPEAPPANARYGVMPAPEDVHLDSADELQEGTKPETPEPPAQEPDPPVNPENPENGEESKKGEDDPAKKEEDEKKKAKEDAKKKRWGWIKRDKQIDCYIINKFRPDEIIYFYMVPENIPEQYQANFNPQEIMGRDSEYYFYSNTSSRQLSIDFKLVDDYCPDGIVETVKRLRALSYPKYDNDYVIAPKAKLVIGTILTYETCIVNSVAINWQGPYRNTKEGQYYIEADCSISVIELAERRGYEWYLK